MVEDSCHKSKLVIYLPRRTNEFFFSTDTHAVFWLKEMKHELINLQKTKVKNIIVYMYFVVVVVVKCFSV